jgi:energy-coupling factor transporter ATP-binding protein EcfA2
MTQASPPFDTFNAKRLTPIEVSRTFVMPSYFPSMVGKDHCYVVGPRGSGKTTLLKMLHGTSLMSWQGREADAVRGSVDYSTIFLPADELWARQSSDTNSGLAFTVQILYAFIEAIVYRTSLTDSYGYPTHLPVDISHDLEVDFCTQCISAWGVADTNPSFQGLLGALDLLLLKISSQQLIDGHPLAGADPMDLLSFSIRAFNRVTGQQSHQWALLLDEMELAPPDIHRAVVSYVRGGTANLIIKITISPFDRYMHGAIPVHDFQLIHLSGQSYREIKSLTSGLWAESLRARNYKQTALEEALPTYPSRGRPDYRTDQKGFLAYVIARDHTFASWLKGRRIEIDQLEKLSYNEKSATIRKVMPLLVFRDALLGYRDGKPFRRSRKKSYEPFTGPAPTTRALEGNPRWIKVAFSHMLNYYDTSTNTVSPGFQIDAIAQLANRFESLLRVLPRRESSAAETSVVWLVNTIAEYMNWANLGAFKADPINCFVVDPAVSDSVVDALSLGLYAGAFVQVRHRRSDAILSDIRGERFRLAYLLGVRDRREYPLRLGKDAALSDILKGPPASRTVHQSLQLGLDL